MSLDLTKLAAYFPADDLDWKPITVSRKTNKGLAAAYITARAVQHRLDDVCGPENWKNEYAPGPAGGVICGISIRVTRLDGSAEWVTKWDGADNTDIEATKGGLSDSMRRAAVQWGIGRYLYDFPQQWVDVDDFGKFKSTPRVPGRFLPPKEGAAPAPPPAAPAPPAEDSPARVLYREHAEPRGVTPEQFLAMLNEAKSAHATEQAALDALRTTLMNMGSSDPAMDKLEEESHPQDLPL